MWKIADMWKIPPPAIVPFVPKFICENPATGSNASPEINSERETS
jgi:hypothetical protein